MFLEPISEDHPKANVYLNPSFTLRFPSLYIPSPPPIHFAYAYACVYASTRARDRDRARQRRDSARDDW